MASGEAASASSLGPRYAPEDPTLPKPWKGLIDGSTGLLYYWNPETNVTQYDRPISTNPPLPPGPPPTATSQKMALLPVAGTLPSNVSATQQQKQEHPVLQQPQLVGQQMPLQNSQQLPFQQTQPINQQMQPVLQSNQIQYPQAPYLQGQFVGQNQGQQLQQQGSQVAYKQQQEGAQVTYQQQQGSQFPYQHQPHQQGSQVTIQQQQHLQGPPVPIQQQQQQQQQQQRGFLLSYHQPERLQASTIPFQMDQQPQSSQPSHNQGQQQPESKQIASYKQGKQPHGQQITANQQGHQTSILGVEESFRQEGKQAGASLPQVQQTGLGPSNHQVSVPLTQIPVSHGGGNSVQRQQQQYSGMPSGGQQFSGFPSGGQQFSGLPSDGQLIRLLSGVQQFNGLSLGTQRFSEPSSRDQPISGLPSGGQHFSGLSSGQQVSGLSSGGQQLTGQQTDVSCVQLHPVGADTSYQQLQMSSPMISNHDGQLMDRPMGFPLGNEEARRERSRNEFLSSNKEGTMMPPQLLKLAPLPQRWNPQDMRTHAFNPQLVSPGPASELNLAQGHAMPHRYNCPPFPNAAPTRPPQGMFGVTEFTNMTAAEAYRQHHEVTAMGENIPPPFMTFDATGFPPEILKEMHLAGFLSPTPIQAQAWPVALQSRDIVAIAKTGSGKTLGYLVPAFILLRHCRNNPQFGPTVLVLAPTRELATQIQDEAIKFGSSSRVSCTCLYGGAPKGPQLRELEQGADIVVATPGRLMDILDMGKINLRQVSLLVLDEADRMLDMGFEPQIRKIVNEIPKRRQTLMYTATWPKEVRKIAGDLLVNPVQVNIGSTDELAANKSITQYVEVITPEDKQRRLDQILGSYERGTKVIIFCSTKKQCDQLARSIGRTFGAASIHGDKSQDERDHALNQFRCGRAPILVATDVAGRGLDIKDIRVVINYDFPTAIEDYVHRIGRTGRAGATGVSYTFFSHQDWKYAADLIKVLEGANQQVPPEVREMAAHGGRPSFSQTLSHEGMSRWDSGGGRGSGCWESDGGHGGGTRNFGRGRGGDGRRNDFYGGRGNMRGRGFGGPGGFSRSGCWGRRDHGPHDHYHNHPDGHGRVDGGDRRRYGERDGGDRRRYGERGRSRSYSRSPGKVRTRAYGRGGGGSRSRSRSRSLSRSWSRSRSRSRSQSRSRSRSQSRSYNRYDRPRRKSLFSDAPGLPEDVGGQRAFNDVPPMLPGRQNNGSCPRNEIPNPMLVADAAFAAPETGLEPRKQ